MLTVSSSSGPIQSSVGKLETYCCTVQSDVSLLGRDIYLAAGLFDSMPINVLTDVPITGYVFENYAVTPFVDMVFFGTPEEKNIRAQIRGISNTEFEICLTFFVSTDLGFLGNTGLINGDHFQDKGIGAISAYDSNKKINLQFFEVDGSSVLNTVNCCDSVDLNWYYSDVNEFLSYDFYQDGVLVDNVIDCNKNLEIRLVSNIALQPNTDIQAIVFKTINYEEDVYPIDGININGANTGPTPIDPDVDSSAFIQLNGWDEISGTSESEAIIELSTSYFESDTNYCLVISYLDSNNECQSHRIKFRTTACFQVPDIDLDTWMIVNNVVHNVDCAINFPLCNVFSICSSIDIAEYNNQVGIGSYEDNFVQARYYISDTPEPSGPLYYTIYNDVGSYCTQLTNSDQLGPGVHYIIFEYQFTGFKSHVIRKVFRLDVTNNDQVILLSTLGVDSGQEIGKCFDYNEDIEICVQEATNAPLQADYSVLVTENGVINDDSVIISNTTEPDLSTICWEINKDEIYDDVEYCIKLSNFDNSTTVVTCDDITIEIEQITDSNAIIFNTQVTSLFNPVSIKITVNDDLYDLSNPGAGIIEADTNLSNPYNYYIEIITENGCFYSGYMSLTTNSVIGNTDVKSLVLSSDDCKDFRGYFNEFCLPIKGTCRPCTDGLFSDCDERYNCVKCQNQSESFMPFVLGDTFMLQTTFTGIETNWGEDIIITLCTDTGLEESNQDLFSTRYYTGSNDGIDFQTIEIDTSLPIFVGVNCFAFRIEVDGDSVCTETWRLEVCPDDTVVVSSQYGGYDCCDVYYDEPDTVYSGEYFKYSNKRRIYAGIQNSGFSITSDRGVVNCLYNFFSKRRQAPFQMFELKTFLAGRNLNVDGKIYEIDNITNQNRMSFNILMRDSCKNSC